MRAHHRLVQTAILAYGRRSRGMTLGVRALLVADGRVLLVRHTYAPGWYLPGGGVERGESAGEALEREVREEAGVRLTGAPLLFGLYRNAAADSRDHVAFYICDAFEPIQNAPRARGEIAERGAFPLDALPADATPATRARLREYLAGAPPSVDW
jgi:ADP-ribose pyrophosphatase YjhB (NUDIX family)